MTFSSHEVVVDCLLSSLRSLILDKDLELAYSISTKSARSIIRGSYNSYTNADCLIIENF